MEVVVRSVTKAQATITTNTDACNKRPEITNLGPGRKGKEGFVYGIHTLELPGTKMIRAVPYSLAKDQETGGGLMPLCMHPLLGTI